MLYNILFSPTGGTGKAADILITALGGNASLLDLCRPDFPGARLEREDVALIAIPSFAGRVPCTAADRWKTIQGSGARAILLCVYGNRAYDNTLAEMKALADETGFRPIAAVAALAEHSMVRRLAAGRPDAQDAAVLEGYAAQIRARLAAGDDTPVQVPGTAPEKPMGLFGGRIPAQPGDSCNHCGLCAKKCPLGAIDPETLDIQKDQCLGCMRCVSLCPQGARKLNMVVESLGGVALSVLCAARRENELFL